jgi:hypothetical protein
MSKWPPPEKQDLLYQHEEFIARVNKIRGADESLIRPTHWWLHLLETSGGAALLTVLIGGLCGAGLNFLIQRDLKDRESQQALLRLQFEQKLITYKNLEDQRQEFLKHLYERVGRSTTAAYDLIFLTGSDVVPSSDTDYQKELRQQRNEIIQRYNSSDNEWRAEQESLELLISYYHDNSSEVRGSWRSAQEAINTYMKCAETTWKEYNETKITNDINSVCQTERKSFKDRLSDFTVVVGNARRSL